jgi:dTDP-4-amino-4,6-dideoxy-D-glucose acyltransferase
MSCYSREELQTLGLAGFGDDVRISRKASIHNPGRILIGNHVRIDDFCVLSAGKGGIELGDYIHISVYCSLIGAGKITIQDFANLSSRTSIFSSNDDYSGKSMTNPMVPDKYTGVTHADVTIGKHVIIGTGSVILPGVRLEEGTAVGSLSLIKDNFTCHSFGLYVGVPARRIGERSRDLLELEKQLRQQEIPGPGDKK